uniref:transmembrane protein 267-like n=1 Tax=Styela clava TaxID=7725 RepID=UPI00193A9848
RQKGCWCWVLVRGIPNNHIVIEICLAGFFSSAIDIDHIIEARSIYPKDLINIHHRSLFHTLTAVPVASFVVWVCSKYIWGLILKYKSLEQLKPLKGILIVSPWIIAVAWTSHQLRDALRRGISLQPFGVTGPVPLWLYVAIVTIVPNFIRLLVSFLHERKQLT